MRHTNLLAALGIVAETYAAAITAEPASSVYTVGPPQPTMAARAVIDEREYNPATEIGMISRLEEPMIGSNTQMASGKVATISKSAISFVAIPSAVTKAVGNVDVGDIVVNLDSNALSKLKTAGDSIKAACAKVPLAKRSPTCVSTIVDAVTSSEGEHVGTIRLIGTSIEEWEASLAPPPPPGSPPPAPGLVVPEGTVFAAPAWAGAAAAGEHAALAAGPAAVAAWLMNYVISSKEAASLNLRPVGKNSKGCQKSTVSRCTNTCYVRPYAADYSVKTSSSCSSACTKIAACSAKGTTTTTTIKPSATYEIEQDEPESYNDRFQVPQAGLGPLADLTTAYCNLGLFDSVKIPRPKCNDVKGNSFVSQKAAADAAYKFCSEPKTRSGKAKENPLAWFNQNSADQFSFSIQFDKDVVFSKGACLTAVLATINGCSIPGNDNRENHKYGGSVDHPCGATFKFSPNPQSATTCDTSKVAPVPYNVFAGTNSNGKVTPPVYGKFCPIVMKDTTKNLGQNVGVNGNVLSNLARLRPRTPPPDPTLHDGDTFSLVFKAKKDGGACTKSCMDGFASLANSPCGHQGGEQNAMAANGKIDIGCGMLEYTINWPKDCTDWRSCPYCKEGQARCNNGKCACQTTKCNNNGPDMKKCPDCPGGCRNCIDGVCGCSTLLGAC